MITRENIKSAAARDVARGLVYISIFVGAFLLTLFCGPKACVSRAQCAEPDASLVSFARRSIEHVSPSIEASRMQGEPLAALELRRERLARDIAYAAEASTLFRDYRATIALVVAVANYESGGFHRSVGNGARRGDKGRSWCYAQLNVGEGRVFWGPPEMREWRGGDLVADGAKCFRAAIEWLRVSIEMCSHLEGGDKISAYTSRGCVAGQMHARHRWALARKILAEVK